MTRGIRLFLWGTVAVVVVAVAVVTVLVVLNSADDTGGGTGGGAAQPPPGVDAAGLPPNGCDYVVVYFRTDEEMTSAAEAAADLPGVASVRSATKADNYARFKEIFADEPDLLDTARPEAMPASIEVRPAAGTGPDRLEDRLGDEFPRDDVRAYPCT